MHFKTTPGTVRRAYMGIQCENTVKHVCGHTVTYVQSCGPVYGGPVLTAADLPCRQCAPKLCEHGNLAYPRAGGSLYGPATIYGTNEGCCYGTMRARPFASLVAI